MEAYQSRVERSPQVEQEIKQRSRDSGTMVELYYSLLKQYEDARLAEDVDHRPAGERFRILDSALPPTSPAAPNRSQLLVLGVVLALALASASILLVDQLDSSFHSVDDLKAFTGVPVLTAIPPIVTSRDAMRRRWRVGLAVAGTVCLLLLTVIATRHLAGGNVQLVRLLSRGKV